MAISEERRVTRGDEPTDTAERLLSRSVTVGTARKKRKLRLRKKKRPRYSLSGTVFKVVLLGVVVLGGIQAIVWLRDFALNYGIVWIGDN